MLLDNHVYEKTLALLSDDHIRMTPRDLYREMRRVIPGITRRDLRDAVKEMVDDGRLIYTHHFSASHLELSFKQPVRVSRRIVLSPPRRLFEVKPGVAVVKLLDGTAFGSGDHPTTRMVLQGLDLAMDPMRQLGSPLPKHILDIGTGSGVLALAALKLGALTALGVDIDPLACAAAEKNADINDLSLRFEAVPILPDKSEGRIFDLILANLRPPTLKQLLPKMAALSNKGATWVLSGFRAEEQIGLEKKLSNLGARHIWGANLGKWAAFAVHFA